MANLPIDQPIVVDLLDNQQGPALSSTTDHPIVETKPDSQAAPEVAEVAADDKTKDESATSPEVETSANDSAPKAKGVQKRLDELTKRSESAERRADAENQEKLRLLALLEETRAKPKSVEAPDKVVTEPEPVKPSRSDFSDPEAWEDALIAYTEQKASHAARQEFTRLQTEEARKREQVEIQGRQEKVAETFRQRRENITERYPDFEEVANTPDVTVPPAVVHSIIHHEKGPDLQYYFGKNPEEAKRLSKLSESEQFIEVGLILGSLGNSPIVAKKPPVSAAPRPIKPTVAGTEPSAKSLDDLPMEEYAARRKADWKAQGTRH